MAEDHRHAAGQATYEVREVLDEDWPGDRGVLFRCDDYVRAVEFAFDYLQRRDPRRDGTVAGLQVLRTGDGRRETVWAYSHAAQANRVDPLRKWGYDVTKRWLGPATPARPLGLAGRVSRRA